MDTLNTYLKKLYLVFLELLFVIYFIVDVFVKTIEYVKANIQYCIFLP
jgi:hypothetical protein